MKNPISLADIFGNFQWKSEVMKNAFTKYEHINSKLSPERRLGVDQMEEFMWFCKEAYNSWFNKQLTVEEKVWQAGQYATRALIHLDNVRKVLRGIDLMKYQSDGSVYDAINSTSDWLINESWYGLPTPIDENGKVHIKKAHGCADDMQQFINAMGRLIAQKEEERISKGRR